MRTLIEILASFATLATASSTAPTSLAPSSCAPPSPHSTIAPSPNCSATPTGSPIASPGSAPPAYLPLRLFGEELRAAPVLRHHWDFQDQLDRWTVSLTGDSYRHRGKDLGPRPFDAWALPGSLCPCRARPHSSQH